MVKVYRAYKLRLYPNKKQTILINKTFGCKIFVYNHFLHLRSQMYKEEKKSLSFAQCCKQLTSLKREIEWLREPDKWALQNALRDLDKAYKNFFKHSKNHPKEKRKRDRFQSYRTTRSQNNIEFLGDKVKLPKLGKVKCKGYDEIKGKIVNATISRTPSGKYYVSICCGEVDIQPLPKTNSQVGIDLGVKEFAITSNGEKHENPKYLEKSLKKLAKLQRSLARKEKDGSNWEKNRVKVARLHEKITNQRKDYLHKLSKKFVEEHDVICLETLRSSNMMKTKSMARSIASVSWYEFTRQLTYKAEWYGKDVFKIDAFYASSQTCSMCGYKNSEVKNLAVRDWVCPECKSIHDRDINAAKNILNEGLKQLVC